MTFPRVGVVGGGQLARMLAPAAIALGVHLRVLAESAGRRSAAQVVPDAPVGAADDLAALRSFAGRLRRRHLRPRARAAAGAGRPGRGRRRRAARAGGPALRPGQGRDAGPADRGRDPVPARGRWCASAGRPRRRSPSGSAGRWCSRRPTGGYDGKGVLVVDGPGGRAAWLEPGRPPPGRRCWPRSGSTSSASWPCWWPAARWARPRSGRSSRRCRPTGSAPR